MVTMAERPAQIGVFVAAIAIATVAGVFWVPSTDRDLEDRLPSETSGRGFTTSDTCQACHPDQYDSWHRSYHRTMTQVATPSTVLADFDAVLEDRGHRWRFERRGDELWVEMPDPVWFENPPWLMQALDESWPDSPPRIEARIVMTTGSHHMQNYWVRRPAGGDAALRPDDGTLVQVPWVWLIEEGRWIPNQDSFLAPPSSSLGGVAEWNASCSQCHSVGTEPRVLEASDGFDTRTVELGIACEACHGPAERHVERYRSPLRRYLRHLRTAGGDDSPDPTIVNPAKLAQRRSTEVCGQCHSFGEWTDQESYRRVG
ncbi:MAG TPA: multiheme c-type cytochrome, partial [Longimicrobiales bacterium]|nr:multiheme c-type cytochrome [Longimicrobiales bacterium]